MRGPLIATAALSAAALSLASTNASAQVPNLTGQYRCVQNCDAPQPALAYVTQNGWDLNLVNEAGASSRAWIDWPGHLWAQSWNEGALYTPDGMLVQFDRGAVWQRVVEMPEPPPAPPPRHKVRRAKHRATK